MSKTDTIERRITGIQISPDCTGAKVFHRSVSDIPPKKGQDESRIKKTKYSADSDHIPHVDFAAAMRAMLNHALAICGMNIDDKDLREYTVIALSIKGDLFANQSRVTFKMGKKVEETGKIVIIGPTPETTLSNESHYPEWADLQKKVKKAVKESVEYLNGKHADDEQPLDYQLDLGFTEQIEKREEKPKKEKKERKSKSLEQENTEHLNGQQLEEQEANSPMAIAQ